MRRKNGTQLLILIGGLFLGQYGMALDDLANNFSSHLDQTTMDSLAKDMGAIMGGGSFHTGKALGFPLGFDVGVHVPVVTVQDDNAILRDDSSTIPAVWGQVEVGLPAKINVIGRVGKLFDADMMGGGLRYGLFSPSLPGLPSVSITGLYSSLKHDYFKAHTYSANLALSFNIPVIRPYVGVGFDSTKLTPESTAFNSVPASVSRDLEGKSSGTRAEAGINLSLIPFTYLTLGFGVANGGALYHAGLGVTF